VIGTFQKTGFSFRGRVEENISLEQINNYIFGAYNGDGFESKIPKLACRAYLVVSVTID
jgi:hypothetical protein